MVAPGVERAARELAGRLKVVKVNVDEAPGISARFGVQGIPTLLLLRDGQPIARQVGALPADRLLSWTREVIVAPAA
jgi:thioredoxin 2